jgi:hypothetical protein
LTLLPPWKLQFAGQNIGAGQSAATTKSGRVSDHLRPLPHDSADLHVGGLHNLISHFR